MYNQGFSQASQELIMGCRSCKKTNTFRQKLGRCRRCMCQLALLSTLCWGAWGYFYLPTPKVVGSITLLFAATAFSSLLLAHWVAALVLWLRGGGKNKRQQPAR